MGKPAIAFVNSYIGHLNYLNKTRSSMKILFPRVLLSDVILNKYTQDYILMRSLPFENFIENLFIGLLVEKIRPPSSQIIPRLTFKSDAVAKDIVLGGRNYVELVALQRDKKELRRFFGTAYLLKIWIMVERDVLIESFTSVMQSHTRAAMRRRCLSRM